MYKRWLVALASLGLLVASVALVWQVDLVGAQSSPYRMFLPLIERRAFPSGTPTTLAVSVTGNLTADGKLAYRVYLANYGTKAITVLPLEFGYNSGSLAFLSAQFTPDARGPGSLRWNDITSFPGIGDLPAATAAGPGTKTFDILMDPVVCPEGGFITVQVLVSGAIDAEGQVIPPNTALSSQKLCTAVQISKTLVDLPSGQALVGDEITYDIVVTNPIANATAPANLQRVRSIQLTDRYNPDIFAFRRASLDTGNGFTPISPTTPITTTPTGSVAFTTPLAGITLNPGDSMRVRVTFEVRSCSSEAGTVNVAEVGSPGAEGALVTQARANAQFLRVICPNIQVTKRIQAPAQGVVALGETITFTMAVKAVGNQAINVVPMEDVFDPTAIQFVSSDPQPNGPAIAGSVIWNDLNATRGRSLQPGETYTVTAVFKAVGCPVGGRTANRARIGNAIASGGGYGFTAPQASDAVEFDIACPRLDVTKRVVTPRSGLIQELGGTATFEIVVRNTGNLPIATIPLTDTFDSALFELVGQPSVRPTNSAPGSLSWDNLAASAPLQPGESVAVLLTLKTRICPDPTKPITSYNRVGVTNAVANFRTSTLPVPNDYDEAAIDVVCAQLKISKTLVSPPDAISPGVVGRNEATFRIDITNTGNITVTRLPLVDRWNAQFMEFVRVDNQRYQPDVPGQGSLSWANLVAPERGGQMTPGQKISFNITFRAIGCPGGPTSANPGDQASRNTVEIQGALAIAGGAGVPAPVPNVYASDNIRIACPKLEIDKRLVTAPDCEIVGVGQNVDYDITIRNVGNSTFVTLPMTDTYESEYMQFVSATPSPNGPPTFSGSGQFRHGTVTWNDLTGAPPTGLGQDLAPGNEVHVRVTLKALKSTYDIIRSPSRQTLNNAAITGAKDEYGFTAPRVQTRDVPVRIAEADLNIQMVQETQFPEIIVNRSNQITDTLGIGGPNTDQLSNKVVVPGEFITYTVTYKNNGPDEARFVRLKDIIPPGTVYVRHTLPQCVSDNITEACYVGEVAPGESAQFKVVIRVPRVTEAGFSTPPGTTLNNTIRIESGFSNQGPTCGTPDTTNPGDNTSTWLTDVLGEFGDAPETAVDTALPGYGANVTATYNGNYIHEWLGRWASGERGPRDARDPDGQPNLNPWNTDFFDDGVFLRNPFNQNLPTSRRIYRPGEFGATERVIISVDNPTSSRYGLPADKRLYLKVWVDANNDGVFADNNTEILIEWNGAPNQRGSDLGFWDPTQPYYQFLAPLNVPGQTGWHMARARLSYGAPPTPTGALDYGETEDYLIGIFVGEAPGAPPGPPQPPRRGGE